MEQYIGLDVSLKDTSISIRQKGKRIWRGTCPSDPKLLAEVIRKRAPGARRVVFETGPLAVWFYHALTAEGLPAICIDARHAKAALDMAPNKTDANDADGLAHLAEAGFYRAVRVKGWDSMLIRTLVAARRQLLKMVLQMANQIRGLMKTFGLVVPKGMGRIFDHHVRSLLASHAELERIILPLLEAWRDMRAQTAKLSRQVVVMVRESTQCRLLTSIPGVGAITATAFAAAIEDPGTFTTSRSVGAWVGLTIIPLSGLQLPTLGRLRNEHRKIPLPRGAILRRPPRVDRVDDPVPSTRRAVDASNARDTNATITKTQSAG